ncbi:winged helix-turn-helix transcriptional regulator [Methanolacinia paynteri]|uniref:winged helix-turn-helix transcriptional regulator n=1 Tax=Methanolacinia paynteri TaxID=230356 RepID=UPI00069345DD|nr:winged helix-turn-helix transcriptional regulator [Methanolacinia paynteri]
MWIKISFILALIGGFLAAIKFFPPIAGRIGSILDNKKRKEILEYVCENPGRCFEEIASAMDIKRDSLRYHIKRLSQGDYIVIENTDNSRRVFPNHGTFSGLERKIISMSHNPTQLKILALITKYPGIRNVDLKDELGISKSAVSWHVGKIESAGLLSCRKSGTARHYYIRSGLERIIVENLPEEMRKNYGFSV